MDFRELIFRNRSYTPVPLALIILYLAEGGERLWIPGGALVILGELLRMESVRYAGGQTRTRKVGAKILCTSGPYAFVRNPIYWGNMMIYWGMVLIADGPLVWMLLVATTLFFSTQYGLIISLEEKSLRSLFDDRYDQYVQAVPRVIPRLSRWKGGKTVEPSPWSTTLRTDRRTVQMILAFTLLLEARVYLFG